MFRARHVSTVLWGLVATAALLLLPLACRQPTTEVSKAPEDWVVEVYQSGSIVGAGCVIGDGNQVLTVFDYGTDIPAGLEVGSSDGVRHRGADFRYLSLAKHASFTRVGIEGGHGDAGLGKTKTPEGIVCQHNRV